MTFNLNLLNKNKFKILIFVVCCVLVLVLIRQLVKAKKKEPFYQVMADDVVYTREVDIQPELDDAALQNFLDDVNTCNVDTTQDVAVSCLGGTNDVFIHKGITEIKEDFVKDKININRVIFEPDGTDDLVIGDNAFSGTSITSVHIPARVMTIGSQAFKGIKQVTFEANSNLQYWDKNAFDHIVIIANLDMPDWGGDNSEGVQYAAFELSDQAKKFHGGSEDHIIVFYDNINDGHETAFTDICGEDSEVEWEEVQRLVA